MEKINIAELLKRCPQGMKLDCTMYEDCKFLDVDINTINNSYLIRITTPCGIKYLDKYGRYTVDDKAKCVIFPPGKTTWDGFVPPCEFKDGDIVYFMTKYNNEYISIVKNIEGNYLYTYMYSGVCTSTIWFSEAMFHIDNIKEHRFATEEEKEKLFKAIEDKGCKWNQETNTLEKLIEPKFKVGDKIRLKENHNYIYTITGIRDEENKYDCGVTFALKFSEQDDWELDPKKFDINTLKPFDSRVLVRDKDNDEWRGQFFSHYDNNSDRPYICIGVEGINEYKQCIPYKGNEYLLGKTKECVPFYQTWKD